MRLKKGGQDVGYINKTPSTYIAGLGGNYATL